MEKNLFIFILRQVLVCSLMPLLNDDLVELELDGLALDDLLLDRLLRDQAVDKDLLLLSDTVGTVHRLQVNLRVPVRVIDYNMVSCHQIDSKTTCPCRDEEDLEVGTFFRELLDALLSVLKWG